VHCCNLNPHLTETTKKNISHGEKGEKGFGAKEKVFKVLRSGSGNIRSWIRFHRIWIRKLPGMDPVLPDQDPGKSGSGSGFAGSRSGNIRIWNRLGRIQIRPPVQKTWSWIRSGSSGYGMYITGMLSSPPRLV